MAIPEAELVSAALSAGEERRLRADRRIQHYPHVEFIDEDALRWLAFVGWLAARGEYDDDIGSEDTPAWPDGEA